MVRGAGDEDICKFITSDKRAQVLLHMPPEQREFVP